MSYTSLLTIVCLANLLQFCLRPRLYTYEKKSQLYTPEPEAEVKPEAAPVGGLKGMLGGLKKLGNKEGDKPAGKKDMSQEEKDLILDDDDSKNHYVWMEPKFKEDRLWVWIVNFIAYIAVITTYICVDGHEIIYSMYLPLDMMLNASKATYFFSMLWVERRN